MESTIVTVNDLKLYSNISENIDVEMLNPHLLIAQQLYLQPVLGDALYSDLINRFNNNTLTGDTQTLYEEYIVQSLAYSAWFSASPFLSYKTNRNGINTQSTDNTTPLTPEELSLYSSRVENFKDFYLNRLEKYLILNNDKFPLFRKNDVDVTSSGGSLYLGFKKKYRTDYPDYF